MNGWVFHSSFTTWFPLDITTLKLVVIVCVLVCKVVIWSQVFGNIIIFGTGIHSEVEASDRVNPNNCGRNTHWFCASSDDSVVTVLSSFKDPEYCTIIAQKNYQANELVRTPLFLIENNNSCGEWVTWQFFLVVLPVHSSSLQENWRNCMKLTTKNNKKRDNIISLVVCEAVLFLPK